MPSSNSNDNSKVVSAATSFTTESGSRCSLTQKAVVAVEHGVTSLITPSGTLKIIADSGGFAENQLSTDFKMRSIVSTEAPGRIGSLAEKLWPNQNITYDGKLRQFSRELVHLGVLCDEPTAFTQADLGALPGQRSPALENTKGISVVKNDRVSYHK